jgi:hypothetical protein
MAELANRWIQWQCGCIIHEDDGTVYPWANSFSGSLIQPHRVVGYMPRPCVNCISANNTAGFQYSAGRHVGGGLLDSMEEAANWKPQFEVDPTARLVTLPPSPQPAPLTPWRTPSPERLHALIAPPAPRHTSFQQETDVPDGEVEQTPTRRNVVSNASGDPDVPGVVEVPVRHRFRCGHIGDLRTSSAEGEDVDGIRIVDVEMICPKCIDEIRAPFRFGETNPPCFGELNPTASPFVPFQAAREAMERIEEERKLAAGIPTGLDWMTGDKLHGPKDDDE